jgi:hypothetical protein
MDELYAMFKQRYPEEKLGLTKFKELRPWNMKKAYRETCLSRMCELFRLYIAGLHAVAPLLACLLEVPETDGDDAAEGGSAGSSTSQGCCSGEGGSAGGGAGGEKNGQGCGDGGIGIIRGDGISAASSAAGAGCISTRGEGSAAGARRTGIGNRREDSEAGGGDNDDAAEAARIQGLESLIKFCSLEKKAAMVNEMVCGGCLESAKPKCISGECSACGFKKIWRSVRKNLVDGQGKLMNNVAPAWQSTVRWETLKSATKEPSNGSNEDENETLRARRSGTVIEFLDEFERLSVKIPAHRELIGAAKAAAAEFMRNFSPGMLISNYDWSENGLIASARQIQSEYWSQSYYSLFITITSYFVAERWIDRRDVLPVGAEVTVEPAGTTVEGSWEPAAGSFYATVSVASDTSSQSASYTVKTVDGLEISGVDRHQLRHRKLHNTAFVCVTDEKRHDSVTSQHFLNKQFEHWLACLDVDKFWAFVGHSDNASHFKSGPMMHYWSNKKETVKFMKMCWIEFGCPGHGKGPWDGLEAVIKQRVVRDMTNGQGPPALPAPRGPASNPHSCACRPPLGPD